MKDEVKKNIFDEEPQDDRDLMTRIDSLLSLAVYRGIDQQWIADAKRVIAEIRQ